MNSAQQAFVSEATQVRSPTDASCDIARPAAHAELGHAIRDALGALLARQSAEGYWVFELEADCTIPAEYVLMMHFLDEVDVALEKKLAVYLRARQAEHGGWPLYHGGRFDISCSVKAYYALKLVGDDPQAAHMVRARAAILEYGGAAKANVFTRIMLATFGQIPWRGVPYVPVEIMLLPKWFPFHLDKVSYWSRTVMVPLLILCSCRAAARNPRGVQVRELFTTPPEHERHYFRRGGLINRLFLILDRLGRTIDPLIPRRVRASATRRAEDWFNARLNGEEGLGAIFPAMVNALEAMATLGYPRNDLRRIMATRALQKLLIVDDHSAYCQPCVSPVWDTALACLALEEEGSASSLAALPAALSWLRPLQLLENPGDWRTQRPNLAGGGWAFQFRNDAYPDLDDTAVVAWVMNAAPAPERDAMAIDRALDWLVGMQSENGGFASFDVDNTYYYLNEIPFADHGALLDPPTSDVTARVVTILARAARPQDMAALERAIRYLRAEQEPGGSWFGRWGTNYVYGTWSVLMAFAEAGISKDDPAVRRAVSWLESTQRADGSWGETNDSYFEANLAGQAASGTPFQTAWALLALMAAECANANAIERGVGYLLKSQQADGLWSDPGFTAPGFPRVFYLRYHGYCAYFPFWALARYRRRQLQEAQTQEAAS
ncbi:MAG TPA: squalene--hopene cyclase [Steroidobacteraceae bacterium]|nr:squalene--hopene cyclase [Steroidobacteraceae bacterium]